MQVRWYRNAARRRDIKALRVNPDPLGLVANVGPIVGPGCADFGTLALGAGGIVVPQKTGT